MVWCCPPPLPPPPGHGHGLFYTHILILPAPLWPVVWFLCCAPCGVVWWVWVVEPPSSPCRVVVGFGLFNPPSPPCGVVVVGCRFSGLVFNPFPPPCGVVVLGLGFAPAPSCGAVVGFGLFNPPSPPLWCGVLWWWVVGFWFSVYPLRPPCGVVVVLGLGFRVCTRTPPVGGLGFRCIDMRGFRVEEQLGAAQTETMAHPGECRHFGHATKLHSFKRRNTHEDRGFGGAHPCGWHF